MKRNVRFILQQRGGGWRLKSIRELNFPPFFRRNFHADCAGTFVCLRKMEMIWKNCAPGYDNFWLKRIFAGFQVTTLGWKKKKKRKWWWKLEWFRRFNGRFEFEKRILSRWEKDCFCPSKSNSVFLPFFYPTNTRHRKWLHRKKRNFGWTMATGRWRK